MSRERLCLKHTRFVTITKRRAVNFIQQQSQKLASDMPPQDI
jgi:hypothetical protein